MKTIKENIVNELIVNKSKFITHLIKVHNEEQALNQLDIIKKQYKDATHYCYAYIIDDIKRFSDDKEPSGTAGIPIMSSLEKNDLNLVIAIVIRYFGGIKLGAGGLVRAYSKAVNQPLNQVNLVNLIKSKTIHIEFDIQDKKQVDYIIKNCNILDQSYNNRVSYIINIELNKLDDINNQLKQINNINIIEINDSYIEQENK